MQLYMKVTSWERYDLSHLDKDELKKVTDLIKAGKMNSEDGIDELQCNGIFPDSECLFETTTYVDVEDNSGYATVELLGDDGVLMLTNK